ncbi:hypothetical protein ZWY2020_016691 [Hordeum vulgare]|nr:hypothetical protein ZWY2020_016691 [Hordeum vulgare]
MDHAGGSSSDGGGAPESTWPNSLDQLATEGLHRLGLLVSPGCRLAKPWRINKDGYPMKGDPPTAEELRTHRGGRYNARGRHAFWDGKSYYVVVAQLRPRRQASVPQPPPTFPPVPEEFDLPPEQVVHLGCSSPCAPLWRRQRQPEVARRRPRSRQPFKWRMLWGDDQAASPANDADADWDGLAVSSDDDDGSDGAARGLGRTASTSTTPISFF